MKAKRSFYNLVFGIGSQLITMALGIVLPRLFLVNFGSETNGLMASIGQIFVYMSLLEAGVGAASLQALYKPISIDDKRDINSILAATSNYYKKTGVYYFFSVIIFAIIYPFIIKSSLNDLTIVTIILLTGMGGVIRYYFQGKYTILLNAEGKGYINTSIVTIFNILISILKITLLLLEFSIVAIQVSFFAITILQSIAFQIYIRKNYSWLDLRVKPNLKAIEQKSSVLIHQISSLIFTNTDILLLTIFCDLKVVSVYVIYNLIFSMIDNVIYTVNSSITFALGQTYHESKEKYKKFYDLYEIYFLAFVFSLFAVTFILILPFVKLYTEGLNDTNYIDTWLPILFVSLKLLSYVRSPAGNAINIAGHFKLTQNRSLLETAINLVLSLVFVNFLGIYGVLIGTIAALLYRSIDMVIYTNRKILNRSPLITIKRWLLNAGLFIGIIFIANIININPTSYMGVILWGIILSAIIIPLFLVLSTWLEKEVYKYSKVYLKIYFNRILGKRKTLIFKSKKLTANKNYK